MFTYVVYGYAYGTRRYTYITTEADTESEARANVDIWFDEITSVKVFPREA